MSDKTGIIYWCFGAGHSSRIIPLAKEFRSRDIDISVAGGGAGKRFVEMNGFEQPGLSEIRVDTDSYIGMAKDMVFDALPSTIRRVTDINSWIKEEEVDKLVTDDPIAVFVAVRHGIETYRVEHLEPDILDFGWGTSLKTWNHIYSAIGGQRIVMSCLWSDEEPQGNITEYVDPLAQEGDEEKVEDYNVLFSPGTFGEEFDKVREILESKGYSVRTVGDEEWETKKTMSPYTEAADCVVCAGFSSIADAVVPGTPTVVFPFIPGQEAIAGKIDEKEIPGIGTAYTAEEAAEEAEKAINGEYKKPEFENGAEKFADIVLED
jgi:hypothetical protein